MLIKSFYIAISSPHMSLVSTTISTETLAGNYGLLNVVIKQLESAKLDKSASFSIDLGSNLDLSVDSCGVFGDKSSKATSVKYKVVGEVGIPMSLTGSFSFPKYEHYIEMICILRSQTTASISTSTTQSWFDLGGDFTRENSAMKSITNKIRNSPSQLITTQASTTNFGIDFVASGSPKPGKGLSMQFRALNQALNTFTVTADRHLALIHDKKPENVEKDAICDVVSGDTKFKATYVPTNPKEIELSLTFTLEQEVAANASFGMICQNLAGYKIVEGDKVDNIPSLITVTSEGKRQYAVAAMQNTAYATLLALSIPLVLSSFFAMLF